MNSYRLFQQAGLLVGLLSMVTSVVYADRDDRDRNNYKGRGDSYEQRNYQSSPKSYQGGTPYYKNTQPPHKGYQLDNRYHHNHYYPPAGYGITKLPPKHYNVYYKNSRYYYYGGVWYRPYGGSYVVIAPPVGVYVPVLPAYYTTIWFGGVPYYYANNVYYVWDAGRASYVVTNPPVEGAVQEQPPVVNEQMYIYPKQGQSEQQQADDRYACHAWGVKQTGYDPTQPPQGLSQEQLNTRQLEYQRAMRACLEGRGYSVN
jgi:hypothetical protein